ncbi:MAG: hypothetical protein N2595_00770, partial [bacterium]|nr:hypothetical protein [bacterium]
STVPQPASQPPQLSPAPQKPSTPPSDFIVLGTESLASTSRPPRLAAASPSAPTSPPPASAAQASTISPPPSSPEPPATSSQSTPAAEPPELARARREEQSRAAATRRRVEAIREQADRDELTTRQFSTEGRVRRAQYDQPTTEASQTPFNNEQLQREYAGIYYLIKRGDAALQQGLHTEAKQHYGNALDRLLKIKEKAPTWQSDIVNYRIDYCRERLRSVQ